MYHDETIINGVLCHRGTPDGEWVPYTQTELTSKLVEVHARVTEILLKQDEIMDQAIDALKGSIRRQMS